MQSCNNVGITLYKYKKKFEVYHIMYRLFTHQVDFEKLLSLHNSILPILNINTCALVLGLLNYKAEGIVTL